MIKIISNGSKWYGQEPDAIEVLLDRLASVPLDPMFEEYGNFAYPCRRDVRTGELVNGKDVYRDDGPMYQEAPKAWRFWGNFGLVSAVFQVDTDEPLLIEQLTAAIRANQATEAYRNLRKVAA